MSWLVPPSVVDRLGWLLVYSLWQFALVMVALAVIMRCLRRSTAASRYLICLIALGSLTILPVFTWRSMQGSESKSAEAITTGSSPSPMGAQPVAGPAEAITRPAQAIETDGKPARVLAKLENRWSTIRQILQPYLPLVVLVWCGGVLLFACRPLLSWHTVHLFRTVGISAAPEHVEESLLRAANQLRVRKTVRVVQSALATIPLVVGYFRPVILLPACVVTGLSASQIESVLAHELAHVRRHDYLVNAVQTIIETLLFYHPAVWWISHQIRTERENCCDDLVASRLGNVVDYGRALLTLEELRASTTVLSLSASGGNLLNRVRRLLASEPSRGPLPSSGWAVGAIMTLVVLIGPTVGWSVFARTHGTASDGVVVSAKSDIGSAESAATAGQPNSFSSVVNPQETLEALNKAIELHPNDPVAYCKRGRVLTLKGAYERAIGDFDEAIRLSPQMAVAYYARGVACLDTTQFERTIADLTEAIRLDPTNAEYYRCRGTAWREKHDSDKAINDLDEAIRLKPLNPGAYGTRGAAWSEKGDHDRALRDFGEAIRLNPDLLYVYDSRGAEWKSMGEYEKAIVDFNMMIKLDPQYSRGYFNRGVCLALKGEHDEAIPDFDQAIRRDPTRRTFFHNRGLSWAAKGDHDKAIANFDETIRLDPVLRVAYLDRGRSRALRHEYAKAIADFTEAIGLDDKPADAYCDRAASWLASGDPDKAIADLSHAIELEPKSAEALRQRAACRLRKGETANAVADYDAAIRLEPASAKTLREAAWLFATSPDVRFRDGRRAVELATKACEATRWEDSFSLEALAAAAAETGDFAAAVRWQKKVVERLGSNAESGGEQRDRLTLYEQRKPFRLSQKYAPPA